MLKPSVTSAPTADMATLTVVQPLTLDRGKGAAGPPGHGVPIASPCGLAKSHRDSGWSRESEDEPRRRSRPEQDTFFSFLSPPRPRCPFPLHSPGRGCVRRALASAPRLPAPYRVAPGRRLCWSGCAGTARRPGLGVGEGQRKLARLETQKEWRGSRLPTARLGAQEEGRKFVLRRRARVGGPAAGDQEATQGRQGAPRGGPAHGGELPSAERAARSTGSLAGSGPLRRGNRARLAQALSPELLRGARWLLSVLADPGR